MSSLNKLILKQDKTDLKFYENKDEKTKTYIQNKINNIEEK